MTRRQQLACRAALLLALLQLLAAPLAAQRAGVAHLDWLAGCWRMTAGTTVIEEQWTSPRGGIMLGVSRAATDTAVRSFEFVRIYGRGDTLIYAAQPEGRPPTEFRTAGPVGDEVVFENAAHDFPQRVRYRRQGDDKLLARVEGRRGGTTRGTDFPYSRVPCPGSLTRSGAAKLGTPPGR